MKYTKFIYALMAAPALLLASCSDYEDKEIASEVYSNDAVRFAGCDGDTIVTEVEPGVTTFTINVVRDSEQAAEYALTVLGNEGDAISVPATVPFAEGQKETKVTVTISSNAEVGKPYKFTLSLDEANMNPYKEEYSIYYGKVSIVKWNNLGKGQFLDTFTFATVDEEGNLLDMAAVEVDIIQRDDKPEMYRIQSPYSAAVLDRFEWTGWYGAISTAPIELTLEKDGDATYVLWKYWGTNLNYQGNAANPILACNQRAFGEEEDKKQTVVYAEDGKTVLYFDLKPEFFINGLGSFGPASVFIAMPGFDLAGMMEVPVCGLDGVDK